MLLDVLDVVDEVLLTMFKVDDVRFGSRCPRCLSCQL